jgi:hypothetical protein
MVRRQLIRGKWLIALASLEGSEEEGEEFLIAFCENL